MITLEKLAKVTGLDLSKIITICTICNLDTSSDPDWYDVTPDVAVAIGLFLCLERSGLDVSHCYLIIKHIYPTLVKYKKEELGSHADNLALLIADGTYCATTNDLIPMNFKEAKVYTEEEAKSLPQPLVSVFYSVERMWELLRDDNTELKI